jgi:hypothetical protein
MQRLGRRDGCGRACAFEREAGEGVQQESDAGNDERATQRDERDRCGEALPARDQPRHQPCHDAGRDDEKDGTSGDRRGLAHLASLAPDTRRCDQCTQNSRSMVAFPAEA